MFYSNFSNFGFGYRAINHSMRRDELVKRVQTIIREKFFVMTKFSKNLFFTSFFARPEKFSRRLQKINSIIGSLVTRYSTGQNNCNYRFFDHKTGSIEAMRLVVASEESSFSGLQNHVL